MVKTKKFIGLVVILVVAGFFYAPFFLSGKLPIPSDTIVGLYSPYRDFFSNTNPNGIPFKNFLITDPVRQTFVWKELAVDLITKREMPTWNPYEMAGKPLLANFQSGVFYPLNVILLLKPFYLSWSFFIILQSFLGAIFMFLFLRNLKLSVFSEILGTVSFVFSGFGTSWLEWGNIISTSLWLPLILFSIDKFFSEKKKNIWFMVYVGGIVSSFFAGHLQIFFYLYLVSVSYFLLRFFEYKKERTLLIKFIIANLFFIIVTFIQWYPTLRFILLSARGTDQSYLTAEGWFIPWKHLIQFLAPDFFGNPATLNYFGTWNYGEMVGYIGIISLFFACYSFFKKNITVIFFTVIILFCFLFALPTGISGIPYILKIPFLSSSQPTRLLFVITFSLSVLAAVGLHNIIQYKRFSSKIVIPIVGMVLCFSTLWFFVFTHNNNLFPNLNDVIVARRNLLFPTLIFALSSIGVVLTFVINKKEWKAIFISLLLLITFFDLLRFAQKFTPFTDSAYLFPNTKTLDFLKNQKGLFRVAVLDRRIMPPNFMTHYRIQTIEGYDPLYLKNYAEYIAASERGLADNLKPFNFNRIITPHNINSPLFNMLNTKYIMTYDDLDSKKYQKIYSEGKTKIYFNPMASERVFFVHNIILSNNVLKTLFDVDLKNVAVLSSENLPAQKLTIGSISINKYSENEISVTTKNDGEGFLVIADTFYPTWQAFIDGKSSHIFVVDHIFRGIFIPGGVHTVQLKNNLY